MSDEVFVLIIVFTTLTAGLALTGMVIRAINRNLDRKAQLQGGADDERVDILDERVAVLQDHMQHLEERVDFTERVLAREASTGKLPEES